MTYWGVAQCETMREAAADRYLGRIGVETYLPLLRVGNRVQVLFPSYIFFRLDALWPQVDRQPGIIRTLKNGDNSPARLSSNIIDEIRAREQNGVVSLPQSPGLRIGDPVRIEGGAFLGHNGIFSASSRQRCWILLRLLGRQVRVQVPERHLRAV
jgi:transcription antitermination factor NusG